VTLGAWADAGLDTLFGTPASTPGITGAAGATYYDLVDATTGKSLFTGGASTTGGVGNTFTRGYVSGAAIDLAGSGGPGQTAFDFGASVTVSGIAAGGDAFSIRSDDAYVGNGYFVTAAKTATAYNAGGGVVGAGEVVNVAKWNQPANSRNLEVRFWNDTAAVPPVLYYDLVDAESEKSLFANAASTAGGSANTFTHRFVEGDKISFSGLNVPFAGPPATTVDDFGISVTIQGTPASGDAFKIQASESVSVFDTMSQLIVALESGTPPGTSGNTHLTNELATVLASVTQIEDNLLRVRASIGSRLTEVDDLDTVGQNLDLQYNETLSRLQDLDYAAAITQLTRQQMELQASQESFARISQMSLFQYL
jgi:flagellar hook-associated protein 3 FlgL